ncbi:cytochrome b-c1 complex subunit 8 [Durotheca rogersii]|uniref:cytochrome b-c1 complex subunit 8 n=1 Tax=Durotheca rogersii TaxID=419775 RepID=UPI00221FE6D1|nr:cytochrome b-c1 complex subunit 8 [Durotheca rogersii]KAI5860168.1 cytochrome b-c1 complex subunit 8 [Durotheca rogersii]
MFPTRALRSGGGGGPIGKYGKFLGDWGNFGGQPQRGIISYTVSSNRQNPLAGTLNDAIFNTWRRFSSQVLYIAPPLLLAYYALSWATERNEYLNSKAGRKEFAGDE